MDQLSQHHRDLFVEVIQSKAYQREDPGVSVYMQRWEDTYKGDTTLATPYNTVRTIRAYVKGDGKFSSGDLWTRHLLVRCFLLEAREPHAGEKQIGLREEAYRYCQELKKEYQNAKEPLVSPKDIAKMEELTLLERHVFDPQQHPSALHKLKGKAMNVFGRT
ncbi:MAG: hypothetical protein Q9186_000327 [Xanthomendoza sp. 1 TL-2023]